MYDINIHTFQVWRIQDYSNVGENMILYNDIMPEQYITTFSQAKTLTDQYIESIRENSAYPKNVAKYMDILCIIRENTDIRKCKEVYCDLRALRSRKQKSLCERIFVSYCDDEC